MGKTPLALLGEQMTRLKRRGQARQQRCRGPQHSRMTAAAKDAKEKSGLRRSNGSTREDRGSIREERIE
jgi:hypothetical protein